MCNAAFGLGCLAEILKSQGPRSHILSSHCGGYFSEFWLCPCLRVSIFKVLSLSLPPSFALSLSLARSLSLSLSRSRSLSLSRARALSLRALVTAERGRHHVLLAHLHQDSVPRNFRISRAAQAQGCSIHACMHIHVQTCVLACVNPNTLTRKHTQTHARARARAHARTHAHTHTQTSAGHTCHAHP